MYFEVQKMNDTAIVGNYRNKLQIVALALLKKLMLKIMTKKCMIAMMLTMLSILNINRILNQLQQTNYF